MIIYQIYPTQWSGLQQIISNIPYFKEMGYEVLWLSPCYPSSGYDNGYDVSDYKSIDPKFGTLNDMKDLIEEAHKNDIKILMDLVINHCSIENEVYQKALQGDKRSQDMFHFYDEPQNNWEAIFGGSAWKYESSINKYVFHAFTEGQIDWNFDNPDVWDYWQDINEFWLNEMNIDGYRIDAVTHMAKGSWDTEKTPGDKGAPYKCAPKLEGYLEQLSNQIYNIKPGAFLMGEANGINAVGGRQWIDKGYFDCLISFEHLTPFKVRGVGNELAVPEAIAKMTEWSEVLGDSNVSYIQSHDIACAYDMMNMSHFELADLVFSHNGHKLIYNGQETGMVNTVFNSREPETISRTNDFVNLGMTYDDAKMTANKISRDNARQIISWDNNPTLTQYYKDLCVSERDSKDFKFA